MHTFVEAVRGGRAHNGDRPQVCYENIGCFRHFVTDPENMPLPMSPEDIGTEFILHTRSNQEDRRIIEATESSVRDAGFQLDKKTKLIVHGFAVRPTVCDRLVAFSN